VKQDREWFRRSFERPTEAQAEAWPAIARGENVLVSALTGSGQTLAALLSRARSPRGRAGRAAANQARIRLAAEGKSSGYTPSPISLVRLERESRSHCRARRTARPAHPAAQGPVVRTDRVLAELDFAEAEVAAEHRTGAARS
jgi:hypothetical protein